jgi:hypothetical protein
MAKGMDAVEACLAAHVRAAAEHLCPNDPIGGRSCDESKRLPHEPVHLLPISHAILVKPIAHEGWDVDVLGVHVSSRPGTKRMQVPLVPPAAPLLRGWKSEG